VSDILLAAAYLVAAILFVLGLKALNSPQTARRGILLAEIGMLFAVVGTLLRSEIIQYQWILVGLAVGSTIGALMAIFMPMTAMPQRIAISHSFGALAATLVIGANDVVNPAARYKKASPLYGMPILNADQAHTVMILKRSLAPGFAGEDNELFYDQKTMMILGDAKATLMSLIQLLKKTAVAQVTATSQ